MLSCPMDMDGMVRQKTAENIAVSIEKLFPWVMSFVFLSMQRYKLFAIWQNNYSFGFCCWSSIWRYWST